MKIRIVILVILLLLPTVSYADYFKGNDIMDLWNNKKEDDGKSIIKGYFAGVQDAYNGIHFCVPSEVTISQTTKVIIRYMKDHPENLHKAGKNLITIALRNAFPCNNESDKLK